NYFFFSSRRRHTRFSRDWSSDVCSSDLSAMLTAVMISSTVTSPSLPQSPRHCAAALIGARKTKTAIARNSRKRGMRVPPNSDERSEERRVGKEYRIRDTFFTVEKKTIRI